MTRFDIINPDFLPRPSGYNHVVVTPAGRMVFLSGMIGWDAGGSVTSSDLVEQFEMALRHVVDAVTAAGGTAESIARLTIYVTDVLQYRTRLKGLGGAYRRVMGRHYPAMALVEVKALFEPGSKIEIEATGVL